MDVVVEDDEATRAWILRGEVIEYPLRVADRRWGGVGVVLGVKVGGDDVVAEVGHVGVGGGGGGQVGGGAVGG